MQFLPLNIFDKMSPSPSVFNNESNFSLNNNIDNIWNKESIINQLKCGKHRLAYSSALLTNNFFVCERIFAFAIFFLTITYFKMQ